LSIKYPGNPSDKLGLAHHIPWPLNQFTLDHCVRWFTLVKRKIIELKIYVSSSEASAETDLETSFLERLLLNSLWR
jgi:hypothetical protein